MSFDYKRVTSEQEAVSLMQQHPRYALLAGGTDLLNELRLGMRKPEMVIDLKGISSLRALSYCEKSQELTLGALVTYEEIHHHPLIKKHFPLLSEAASNVACNAVRHRATLVGNITSAVPCLDAGAPLMVYEGVVKVFGPQGERSIPIEEWFLAPRKTSLKDYEFVTHIHIQKPATVYGSCYMKQRRYKGEDLAQGSVAILILPDHHYRVAFGSLAPTPVRAKKVEAFLKGKSYPFTQEVMDEAKVMVESEIAPISDVRSSKEYRLHMSKIMMERSFQKAFERKGESR